MASLALRLHRSLGAFRMTLPARYTPVPVTTMSVLVLTSVPSQMPSTTRSAKAIRLRGPEQHALDKLRHGVAARVGLDALIARASSRLDLALAYL